MSYWELETEYWETEDNYDGAFWMTERGRKQRLEQIFTIEFSYEGVE